LAKKPWQCGIQDLMLLVVLIAAFSKGGIAQKESDVSTGSTKSTPQQVAESQKIAGNDYVIGPGDVLNIFVWREPELSKSVPVSPDGKISLPLINELKAEGLTVQRLRELIVEGLKKFIAEPVVTVTVEVVNSKKVVVMGEVLKGGARPIVGPTRVMDILSDAGLTPFAKTTKIYVMRIEDGKQTRFPFNYKDYVKGKNVEQNIPLKNGDTIVVP
jgi:polysaccharide export outer membrane protein